MAPLLGPDRIEYLLLPSVEKSVEAIWQARREFQKKDIPELQGLAVAEAEDCLQEKFQETIEAIQAR